MINFSSIRERVEDALYWLNHHYRAVVVVFVVSLLATFICQDPFQRALPQYQIGEIAQKNIKAPKNIRVIDEELTDTHRQAAANRTLEVYDYDASFFEELIRNFQKASERIQERSKLKELQVDVEKILGVQLSQQEWALLNSSHHRFRLALNAQSLIKGINSFWIIDDPELITKPQIIIRDIRTVKEVAINQRQLSRRLLSLDEAKREILKRSSLVTGPGKALFSNLTARLLRSTLAFNKIETSARVEEDRSKIEPLWVEISRGEMIVREGQRVDRKHFILLKALAETQGKKTNLFNSFLFGLLIGLLICIFYWVGIRNFRKFKLTLRDMSVIGGFYIVSIALIQSLLFLFYAAALQSEWAGYLIFVLPLGFAAMTLRLFVSMEITIFFSLMFSVAIAWMTRSPYIGLVAICVSLAGAARMRHISQRLDVFRAGIVTAGVQASLMLLGVLLGLVEYPGAQGGLYDIALPIALSVAAGIQNAAIVLAVQPLLEYLGYTTDLRLMELSNTNNKLLKEMIIKAPGTYFHSFTVSQLAEKAAESINANALFARVAALYHDVGKIKKPNFFIENIKGENKHDKLAPSMSALIISNHVKDGIDIAKAHGLPQNIIDVIPQHHGTSLISFFYNKAKEQSENPDNLKERDFRYPGPKPQTREAAIILLADACEATVKSMSDKSIDQIRQVAHRSIERFFLDGQLDECELTLKDLNKIENAFVLVLDGVYHQRIDYPHLRKQKEGSQKKDKEASQED